jgi:predicted RNA-binding protein with PUA-like domain
MTTTPGLWLMKSEPAKYGFADLERDRVTDWDGVRNNQAAIYLRSMKIGDQALFYESVTNPGAVGIMEIVGEAFLDPRDPAGRFPAVKVAPVRRFASPVSLAMLKADPALKDMLMFRQFRLSITPVTAAEWARILELGG